MRVKTACCLTHRQKLFRTPASTRIELRGAVKANVDHHASGCFSYTEIFCSVLVTGFYTYPDVVGELGRRC